MYVVFGGKNNKNTMKTIVIHLSDEEHATLLGSKNGKTWREYVLGLPQ